MARVYVSSNAARPHIQPMLPESRLDLTIEQRDICRAVADAAIGAAIKVQAFAGTGKTTTLAAVARAFAPGGASRGLQPRDGPTGTRWRGLITTPIPEASSIV